MPTVLLVEDDARLSELVSEYLTTNGFTVSVEADGSAASSRIIREQPDVVILDIMLPGENGLAILRRIRKDFQGAVIMLTARGDEVDEVLGLELGADDYMAKPVRPRLLLARLEALLRRRRDEPAQRVVDGDLVADLGTREVRVAGDQIELTTAEFDLLWFMLSNAGRPVTRDELFETLRGISYDGLDRSMDVRMSQLRKRVFTDRGLPSRIVTVRGTGYQYRLAR
jgi:two-component system, OmpR family, response regulator RstA